MRSMTKKGSKWRTQTVAMQCVYFLRFYGYFPKTIINVGLGPAYELEIWHWLLPEAKIVGIDPMPRHKFLAGCPAWATMRYVQSAAHDRTGIGRHCSQCHAMLCSQEEIHKEYRREVSTIRIDDIANEYEPPYFLWMDVDGCELSALQGAEKTLEKTDWLNAEFHEWRPGSVAQLEAWIITHGYHLFFHHPKSEDRLYQKMFADDPGLADPMKEIVEWNENLEMAAERERLRCLKVS